MTEEMELKPCPNPWCESDEQPFVKSARWKGQHYHHVECTECDIEGPTLGESEAAAITAWNTRNSDQSPQGENAAGG